MGDVVLLTTVMHGRADYSAAAATLALALARRGKRVLTMDLLPDVHAAHATLGLAGEAKGLEWVLFGSAPYQEMTACSTEYPDLHVLSYQGGARPTLPPDPLKRLCQQAARSFDVVLVACTLDQGPWVADLETVARASVLLVPAEQGVAVAASGSLPRDELSRHVLVTEARPETGPTAPDYPDAIAAALNCALLGALPAAPEGSVDPAPAEMVAEHLLTRVLNSREPQAWAGAPAAREPVPPSPAVAAPAPVQAPVVSFRPAPLLRELFEAAPLAAADEDDGSCEELDNLLADVQAAWRAKRRLAAGHARLEQLEAEYATAVADLQALLKLENQEPATGDAVVDHARRLSEQKAEILRLRQELPHLEEQHRTLLQKLTKLLEL